MHASQEPAESWLSLSDFIAALRTELRTAHEDAERDQQADSPRFVVGPVTVEFAMAARKEAEGKAGVRFYVFELGAGGSVASEATQRVTLTLTPTTKQGGSYKTAGATPVAPE